MCSVNSVLRQTGMGLALHMWCKMDFLGTSCYWSSTDIIGIVWKHDVEYYSKVKSKSVRGKVVLLPSTIKAHKGSWGKVSLVQADM